MADFNRTRSETDKTLSAARVRVVIAILDRDIALPCGPNELGAVFDDRRQWNVAARRALTWCLTDEGVKLADMLRRQRKASDGGASHAALSWVLSVDGDHIGRNVVALKTVGV